jgi:hypothetical protein
VVHLSNLFSAAIRRGRLHLASFAADATAGCAVPNEFDHVPATAWLYDAAVIGGSRSHATAVVTLIYMRDQLPRRCAEAKDDDHDPCELTLVRKYWLKNT